MVTNDAVIFGFLALILGFVFKTSASDNRFWKSFYGVVPALLMCYFIPSLLNSFGIVDTSQSKLYFVASRYLLPASLVLLTISTDFGEIKKLGSKAIIMFLTGTFGIVLGGPIALLIITALFPDSLGVSIDQLWRGMTTLAGSWIGGGANQAAMKEVFKVEGDTFSKMVTVDILVANAWMAILLIGAGKNQIINKWLNADDSSIEQVKRKLENYKEGITRVSTTSDLMVLLALGCGITGISHWCADYIVPFVVSNYPQLQESSLSSSFFWIVVISTTLGLGLSFTKLRNVEGAGASKIGTVFIYILVATIGLSMDVTEIFDAPVLFLLGIIWMSVHIILLLVVGRLIKAPFFFIAVGSQANVGAAASAPIVASAFNPSLAPVGVLLAVLGYALGTYAAIFCGVLMQWAAL